MITIIKNLTIILFCSVVIGGCGRREILDLPSSKMIRLPQGEFVSESKVDKPFILDPLIQ
ncbi:MULTISPECIES: hypothetical protein [unclassified Bartonella]|uniref:hypothetical protein n=1 Tax=unclassified Bartonella TaxID=2645622 RepID=UPI000999F5D0|nr:MULTISPECIES: hypothetical protein [unclassified Bartonella]AQX28553.1 hypothetical protein BJB15x_011820 [Bartonella sp. JB15]AQX29814.1 hypothetical protein BJB63x_011620 [Bartonella sp. JB63]